ncbi:hypothetical protein TBH_C1144 [Thiolapillus brandeum]|uniref:Uncharacterized protein n=1 Tax=Thiolapillus brandeum TaxID=1076588 RepID=A0A7U6GI67_9GAMM|nr:hypothetical protein TBH_C1144 [Thiolapillus brandeum]
MEVAADYRPGNTGFFHRHEGGGVPVVTMVSTENLARIWTGRDEGMRSL